MPAGSAPISTRCSTSALAIAFLPLTGRAAALLERLMPEPPGRRTRRGSTCSTPTCSASPPLALNAATRAMLRLADKVELMLRETLLTFEETDTATHPRRRGAGAGGRR